MAMFFEVNDVNMKTRYMVNRDQIIFIEELKPESYLREKGALCSIRLPQCHLDVKESYDAIQEMIIVAAYCN